MMHQKLLLKIIQFVDGCNEIFFWHLKYVEMTNRKSQTKYLNFYCSIKTWQILFKFYIVWV